MEQRRLYKTLNTIASEKFPTEEDLLIEILKQVVRREQIQVTGGRIWKLNRVKVGYELVFQTGDVQEIPKGYLLPFDEYPVFDKVTEERTILASETNKFLMSRGIFKYSAAGIGSKEKVGEKRYYEYLLAVNSSNVSDELRYTLNIIATVLTSKLRESRLSTSRKNLMADIDKAKQLQKSILPEHEYRFHNYDLFGITLPAETVGGDFFDYLEIGSQGDRLGIAVGDAASKGLGAAAEAMYISGALRMASTFEIKITSLFFRMNELINKIFSDDKFSTLFYCEIANDQKGICLYANAGHNPPMVYEASTGEITELLPTGPLLGPAPHSRFGTDSFNFSNDDVLVIYSDGVVEAANPEFEFFEEQRLKDTIKANAGKTPKEIAIAILDAIEKFSTSDSKYQDDKTIVVVKRKDN